MVNEAPRPTCDGHAVYYPTEEEEAETLQKIDIQIKQMERQKVIVVTGTHNLTLATLSKISAALGENIIQVAGHQPYPLYEDEVLSVAEPG